MLYISKAMTADAVLQYFAGKKGNYFIDGHELPGIWGGELMKEWGLHGKTVDKEPFERIVKGYDPLSGQDMTQERREERRAANDITISAPKDFSLVYLAEKDEGRRQKLLQAFERTCDWIMGLMEKDAATRVRVGGADHDRKTSNWGHAGFLQFDSRPESKPGEKTDTLVPTIQIHRHHTVFNFSRDPVEQRIKALQIGMVKDNADLWMPLFHNELARRCRALGQGVRREKETGIVGFAMAGVPRALVMRNSPRRLTILDAKKRIAAQEGITDPERLRRLQAELGKLTRNHKQKNLSHEELIKFLERQLSPEDRGVLQRSKGQRGWITSDAEAMRFAIEHLFYRDAVVPEKKLLIEALRYGVGSATLDGLKAEMKRQGVLVKEGEATTREVLGEEGFYIGHGREGKGTRQPLGVHLVHEYLAGLKTRRPTGEQEGVLLDLAGSSDAVNMLDAGQGTGKTTLLEHYARILERAKVRATWLGTTHTAVDELKARGLPAMTLASFLQSKDAQRKGVGSRIILDESSMLGHKDMYRLCQYAREQGGGVIDLVGDSKQYKTPAAGNPMATLVRFAGIVPITMTKTMRQQGDLKIAMEAIRDGNVLKGFDILTKLGMVHELPLEQLAQKAAERYLQWSAEGKEVPVISPTHAQAAEVAAKIRQGLRARGDLTGEDRTVRRLVNLQWSPAQLSDAKQHGAEEGIVLLRYGAYREDTQPLAVGDLVKTAMGGRSKDGKHTLRNGQKFRIAGFTDAGDPILDSGAVVDKNWGGLVQRYVSTGQGAQGKTAGRDIVVYGTPSLVATRQEGFYVPVSRVTTEAAILTDSVAALREAIQRQERRKSATELMGTQQVKSKVRRIEIAAEFVKKMQHAYGRLRERMKQSIEHQVGLHKERHREGIAR